jgi:hypothetical protein
MVCDWAGLSYMPFSSISATVYKDPEPAGQERFRIPIFCRASPFILSVASVRPVRPFYPDCW